MSIFTTFLRKSQGDEPEGQAPVPVSAPPLILLLPDASGIASYRFFAFPTAIDAERFIDSHLRGKITPDTVLFWGLGDSTASPAETIVLIRSDRAGSVNAFSFTDLLTATDFVRHEMNFGLTLDRVLIYWVAGATLDLDAFGRSSIMPPLAPTTIITASASQLSPPPSLEAVTAELTVENTDSAVAAVDNTFDDHVIQFPVIPGRFRLQADTSAWWRNMVDAMDEALDAYVATRVAATLAWSRLTRELAVAAAIQAKMPPAQRETTADESAASVDETLADGENEDAPDTGDDPWFIPRPEWQKRPDGPFKGFNSPHGRF